MDIFFRIAATLLLFWVILRYPAPPGAVRQKSLFPKIKRFFQTIFPHRQPAGTAPAEAINSNSRRDLLPRTKKLDEVYRDINSGKCENEQEAEAMIKSIFSGAPKRTGIFHVRDYGRKTDNSD